MFRQLVARPVTFSCGSTTCHPQEEELLGRTSTTAVEMAEADQEEELMGRTSTTAVVMADAEQVVAAETAAQRRSEQMDANRAKVQRAMSVFAASDAKQACKVVQALARLVLNSQGQFEAAKQNFVAEAGCDVLVHALSLHAADPTMLYATVCMLVRLCYGNAAVSQGVYAAGVVELLLGTMATHMREPRLQQESLCLAAQLAQYGGSGACAGLVSANIVEAIATAMQTHSQNSSILRYGSNTLNALLSEPSTALHVATQIWHLGIAQMVQTALPSHSSTRDFEKLVRSADQLAELMSQAAVYAAQAATQDS
jgi:hypothetical protein